MYIYIYRVVFHYFIDLPRNFKPSSSWKIWVARLDGCGRLGGHVIADAIDAFDWKTHGGSCVFLGDFEGGAMEIYSNNMLL